MPPDRLTIIGGGNMARAIVEGGLRAGVLPPDCWRIVEPDAARRAGFERLGVRTLAHASALAGDLTPEEQLMLAVKPQSLAAAAGDLAGVDTARVVVSMLAGTPSPRIRAALGEAGGGAGGGAGGRGEGARVVRVMPNTPARLGEGATAIALGAGTRPGDEALALRVFSGVGPLVERIDEALMDAFTAVAGSGPAYLFYVAEAMTEAAVSLGFDEPGADRIVRQTLKGAALLLSDSQAPAPDLRRAVTSPGGTTQAATEVLDREGVREAFIRALTAARDRGRELGAGSGA